MDKIRIEHLYKSIAGINILNDISLAIEKGTCCGIIGNNGSGKTVLFKCILGFYKTDSGDIYVDGVMRKKTDGIISGTSAVIEEPAFIENMSGIMNLRYLYELNHKKDVNYLQSLMKSLGLDPCNKKPVKKYSLGMRQRLSIAQLLMDDNDFLIIDEPMNGLDKRGVEEVRAIFLNLKDKGKTLFISSHNPKDIDILCDKTYEIDNGTIISS